MLCRLGSGGVFSAPLRGMSNGIQEGSVETHLSGAEPDPWVRECEMARLWFSFLSNLAVRHLTGGGLLVRKDVRHFQA